MSTQVFKGREGWEAKTQIKLGIKSRFLVIHTHKTSGGMVTSANVFTESDGCLSFVMFSDYAKRVQYKGVRCTEKTVRDLHAQALEISDLTMSDAAKFYAAKDGIDGAVGECLAGVASVDNFEGVAA